MTVTSYQTQACFEAWINCENLLVSLAEVRTSLSKKITRIVNECALICMGTFHAMKSQSKNINNLALLCVGICEECAELCEEQSGKNFQECAKICRECSNTISVIARY